MKAQKETRIEPVFHVETIVSIHHCLPLQQPPATGQRADSAVVYDFWQLFLLERGSYTCQIEGCLPGSMEAGQLLICEPRKLRYSFDHNDAAVSIINIRCGSPRLKQMKNRIFTLTTEDLALLHKTLDIGGAIFQRLPDDAPFRGQQPQLGTADYQLQSLKNRIELLLISLWDSFSRNDTQPLSRCGGNDHEAKFLKILAYMKGHLREALTLDDLCRETGFSRSTVKRVFESQTDCGAMHYFLKLKIQEAKDLLTAREMSVTEISEALGFSGIHYFSRLFKSFTGLSPTGYVKAQLASRKE